MSLMAPNSVRCLTYLMSHQFFPKKFFEENFPRLERERKEIACGKCFVENWIQRMWRLLKTSGMSWTWQRNLAYWILYRPEFDFLWITWLIELAVINLEIKIAAKIVNYKFHLQSRARNFHTYRFQTLGDFTTENYAHHPIWYYHNSFLIQVDSEV